MVVVQTTRCASFSVCNGGKETGNWRETRIIIPHDLIRVWPDRAMSASGTSRRFQDVR